MNYNFHSSLSPIEFERFVRDILEIREGRTFESFGVGPDGGIDLRSEVNGDTIICQVKCFQNGFPQLLSTLKKSEVAKAKKLAPQRYILATSISFLPQQKDKIQNLFAPFIRSSDDILGRDDLNKLLGKQEYHEVERRHYKLWITSSNVLFSLLAAEIRRGEYNETSAQLEEMKKQLPRYVQNRTFPEALSILERNRFVLVTGPPGIGKTMLGQALAAHFIEQDSFQLVFVRSSVSAARSQYVAEKRQVFFMDDFWGSVFEKDTSNRNEDKSLLQFLKLIEGDSNKALILTSREYVFQRGSQRQNYSDVGQFLSHSKCMVTHESFSEMDKARILYNHIYFSKLPKYCIEDLVEDDQFLQVINHRNYTPRAIEQFIDREFGRANAGSNGFAKQFLEYLSDPYEFWIEAFEKQSNTGRLILLILAISNPPMRWSALIETAKAAVVHAASLGVAIDVSYAEEALQELDRTFVLTKDYYGHDLRVDFQNPSLNDVMLRYLRSKMESWVEILLKSALFFNQLDFAFTSTDGEYIGPHSGYLEYGGDHDLGAKIVLRDKQAKILRSRILSDFDNLGFTAIDPYSDSEYSQYSEPEKTQAAKLIRLSQLFDPAVYPEVQAFICERYRIIEKMLFDDDEKGGSKAVLKDIPALVKVVKPHLSLEPERLIEQCYDKTTFVAELLCWAEFDDIFPVEYQLFNKHNRSKIKKHVRHLILWDAEWYGEDEDHYQLDMLFDWQIDAVLEEFKMPKSESFMKKVAYAAGDYPHQYSKTAKKKAGETQLTVEDSSEERFDEERVRAQFKGLVEDCVSNYVEEQEVTEFVKQHCANGQREEAVLTMYMSQKYSYVFSDRLVLSLLCRYYNGIDLPDVDDDLLIWLTKAELTANLGEKSNKTQIDDLLTVFAAACFCYYFGHGEPFLSRLAKLHQSNNSKLGSLMIEEFHEILIPFFDFDIREGRLVSDRIGRAFACRHLCAMEQSARIAFYRGDFARFSDEDIEAMDWWSDFLHHDRRTFLEAFLIELGESAIAAILNTSPDQRFLVFLKLMGLNFNVVLGIPDTKGEESFSLSAGRQVDFFEYIETGLSGWDTWEFLWKTLAEEEADCLACEVVYFKDVREGGYPERPHARIIRLDFGQLEPSARRKSIVRKLGEAFGFESKFEELRRKFDELLTAQRE